MIQKLSNKVYVVGGDGSANVVIVVDSKGAIVVDTSLFEEKARKIREFIEGVLKKRIYLVINTHYHPDHCFGNIVFDDVQILSSSLTKKKMSLMDADYLKDLPMIKKPVLPSITFEEDWCDEYLQIAKLGGHTPDSSIVIVRDEKILVAGDLVFNGFHPEIVSDSNLEQWITILEDLRRRHFNWVIPGHGEPMGMASIDLMVRYLSKIKRLLAGTVTYAEILSDDNFSKREFPELFSWGIENLLSVQRAR
ncbi:MBL fold metallo-hydrolase [Pseudothermotoga elfii]